MGLPKKLRFEVLKRDHFKCQYCGAEAPGVLLHVDHIKPKAKGGKNDIVNLVTACAGCNLGKGAIELTDDSAVTKSRAQMEDLQAHREQLEMMMKWREGLRDFKTEEYEKAAEYFLQAVGGDRTVSRHGEKRLRKAIKDFGLQAVLDAIDVSTETYLELDDAGNCSDKDAGTAFDKIGGICFNTKKRAEDPEYERLMYIRGIARKRCGYFQDGRAMQMLKEMRALGMSLDELQRIATEARNWTAWNDEMWKAS